MHLWLASGLVEVNATFARAATVSLIALFGTLLVVAVAVIGILGIRSATYHGQVIAGGELDTAGDQPAGPGDGRGVRRRRGRPAGRRSLHQVPAPRHARHHPSPRDRRTALLAGTAARRRWHPPAERADLELFIRQWDAVRDLLSAPGLTAQPPAARAALADELTAAYQPVSAHLDRLVRTQLSDASADHAAASATADRTTDLILGTAAAGIAMAWFFLWSEFRRIRRSLQPGRDQAEFADTLQLANGEEEAHQLLQRHLERTLPATAAVVLNRNNSADRLEAVSPCPPGRRWRARCAARSRARAWRFGPAGRTPRTAGGRPLLSCPVCAPLPGPRRAFRSPSAAR